MRFAVLWVPDFGLRALQRAEPGLANRPVALVEGEGRRAVISEFSSEAPELSVGLPVPLATARCPGLQICERSSAAEIEAQRHIIAAAFQLSPRVESTGPGCCTVDLQGADLHVTRLAFSRQAADLQNAGLPVQIGAGATPLLARYAAQRAAPISIVEDAVNFLAQLPLDLAEPSPKQKSVLASWGITTLGQLTAISKADLGERLGTAGAELWQRASGGEIRPLKLTEISKSFVAEWLYEAPLETLEPLLFKLRRYAERLAAELRAAGWVAQTLTLSLLLEDETSYQRDFRLPEPGCDVDVWLRALQTHLDTVRLEERVCGAGLTATPTRPEHRQQGLFETGLSDPHAFWENLARLSALVGADRVGTPTHVDSHAPDVYSLVTPTAVIPAPEASPLHLSRAGIMRRFRPPLAVVVECEGKRPVAVGGAVSGVVRVSRGPVILRGDWWTPTTWSCELWTVELESGGLYQLVRSATGWSIDGTVE